jgi:CRP-like cAMP-binding protein
MFTLIGRRGGKPASHRQWVYFQVDFRHPPTEVCAVVAQALRDSPLANVAPDPPPGVTCLDLARENRASFALYGAHYHILDPGPDEPTSAVVRGRIHAALRRAGIPLARPSETRFHVPQDIDAERVRGDRRRERARDALRANRLFESLSAEEVDYLSGRLRFAPFDAGELVTRQGRSARWLYVLAAGSVQVVTEVDGQSQNVATLQAPNVFGEMGLMTGEARLASIVALTPVVCHRLDKAAFEEVLRKRPSIAEAIAGVLAERRVGLAVVRENLTSEAGAARVDSERLRILDGMRAFFGLE